MFQLLLLGASIDLHWGVVSGASMQAYPSLQRPLKGRLTLVDLGVKSLAVQQWLLFEGHQSNAYQSAVTPEARPSKPPSSQ